ncbi:MAG: glycosyltransferase family 4 protein, partial [Clostridia bacterium]|nr:glycosyltransferase family 4 protein [Clostridia bacterium]
GGAIADRMERRGVRQYRFSIVGNAVQSFISARRMLKKLILSERYDIVHAHTRGTALMMRGIVGFGRVSASVVTVHAAFEWQPFWEKICYWGEKTIAVSEDLRVRSIDFFDIPAEAITVVPNGVDCEGFSSGKQSAADETVLFASRLDADCALGAELLIRIAPVLKNEFPNLEIRIAGGGSELKRLQELAKKANTVCKYGGNGTVVSMLGQVENMTAEYQKSRIFVGVSRAALEASACGCAVVLCGNEGRGGMLSPELPSQAMGNFCCRGEKCPDEEWLLRWLRYLLRDPIGTARMAEAASTWVRKTYNAERMAEQTEVVYYGLVQENKRGTGIETV